MMGNNQLQIFVVALDVCQYSLSFTPNASSSRRAATRDHASLAGEVD